MEIKIVNYDLFYRYLKQIYGELRILYAITNGCMLLTPFQIIIVLIFIDSLVLLCD